MISATPSQFGGNPDRPVEKFPGRISRYFLPDLTSNRQKPAEWLGLCITHGSPVGVCLPCRHDHGVLVGDQISATMPIGTME